MKKISLLRSIKHDYALLGCLLFVVVSFGFMGYFIYSENFDTLLIFYILLPVFVVLGFIRFIVLKSYFSNGIRTQGVIVDIWFTKDRGRVTYSYKIDGQLFTSGNVIMKTKETKMFRKGEPVNLLIKSDLHNKAIIENLYSK